MQIKSLLLINCRTPIHWWIHPWIPILKNELSDIFPDIRRKLVHALLRWSPSDTSALKILSPWKGVFDVSSMDNLILRSVVPKLVTSMRDVRLDPQNTTKNDTDLFEAIMLWHQLVPRLHFICLLEGEFFPRWLQILGYWLSSAPDLDEVTQWYIGWKTLFPEDVISDDTISKYFNYALELMEKALSISDPESGPADKISFNIPAELRGTDYYQLSEKRKTEISVVKRLDELRGTEGDSRLRSSSRSSASNHVTFKQLVEEFALRNNVSFLPRPGRYHEDKQIYSFGKISMFIDQGVVFMQSNDGSFWEPVPLERLLLYAT